MAVFKCKMCGGDLNVIEGKSSCTCEFCGTEQSIPTANDENLQRLFNRANILRMKAEFDKAAELYEKIIQSSETEAEAYWGLILCKYGIEYVEDPVTFNRIPTCHRASYEAITADEDYRNALKYADIIQRELYEMEAKAIAEIQKRIITVSQNEDSYDVFICYKETDENGNRTPDSVIANEIYFQLIEEGLNVFYSAISLEDKLGSEYEPSIFSALNTAKVMLVIGTKPEYFNAVWVKNEWSRFLKLMKKDTSKMIIPCYKDMDAYELPEEFAHIQAQDMSKIGFIIDLIRGIKKIVLKNNNSASDKEIVVVNNGNVSVAPLLKRAFMFLEDGDWNKADEFCEQVLNIEPENAQAYVGKLMAELSVHFQSDLLNCAKPFDNYNSYKKAIRFASTELRKELEGYVKSITERNERNHLNSIYDTAEKLVQSAKTEKECIDAARFFESISTWKDASKKAEDALEKAEVIRKDTIYDEAIKDTKSSDPDVIMNAKARLESIADWRDAAEVAERCPKLVKAAQEKNDVLKKSYYCKSCDTQNVIGEEYCSNCGQRLTPYVSVPSFSYSENTHYTPLRFKGIYTRNSYGWYYVVFCPRCGSENCQWVIEKMFSSKNNPSTILNKIGTIVKNKSKKKPKMIMCCHCGKIFYNFLAPKKLKYPWSK